MAVIKTALISVSDKTGLIEFAKSLEALDIKILSTGGTAEALKKAGISFTLVSDITGFPEMMEGRVKTLHPKIHGGILGKRDQHESEANQHGIEWIDLVVVNLYPFAQTVKSEAPYHDIIENIDIGGPAMIRAAAKNMDWVSVIVDPKDYQSVLDELKQSVEVSLNTRKKLAAKAFAHTACYDTAIAEYLNQEKFPQHLSMGFELAEILRYGENPHQEAALYKHPIKVSNLLGATQLQGKALSYNNLVDAQAALECVQEFSEPACVIVKHANPCGAATASNSDEAFTKAWQADSQSAFGGIVALNRPCTEKIAQFLSTVFIELIIAPGFDSTASDILRTKPNCRLLDYQNSPNLKQALSYKFIDGGLLVQDKDHQFIDASDLKLVTSIKPNAKQIQDLLFAWKVVKHLKSNAILIVKDQATLGVGCGQVSRIDAVELAIKKAKGDLSSCVLASDGFFPFRDNIDAIAKTGIKVIIQPGGSIKDEEVIAACNEHGIAMVMTNSRCFNH
ncbi:MAG: phosphoribosylaminoimidazolecarboxamide formyltransferase/IMP cyclohydrolase [Gammaproteobacteria bacterium]|jgi:phosphoribosylaminoimidazolecarboxamide formyltransferase/IMP cyclohydrolase|nr:phosphoribosylaminoimidazolecarboxamide formyltransferase/IMP cyclohydrolase [Gammaproteobacteria bacterium]